MNADQLEDCIKMVRLQEDGCHASLAQIWNCCLSCNSSFPLEQNISIIITSFTHIPDFFFFFFLQNITTVKQSWNHALFICFTAFFFMIPQIEVSTGTLEYECISLRISLYQDSQGKGIRRENAHKKSWKIYTIYHHSFSSWLDQNKNTHEPPLQNK